MNVFKKVKASALQYVLIISVIIALVVFAFIGLVSLQQRLQSKNTVYKEAIRNVQSAFQYLEHTKIDYNEEKEIQLSDIALENTIISKKHWGAFDMVTITCTINNESFTKVALVGNNNQKQDALHLQENNTPLVVVGKTKIVGNASLPKQGVKTGNIAGTSFYGNQLLYGRTKRSSSSLPSIQNLSYLKSLKNSIVGKDENLFFELEEGMLKEQTFLEETIFTASNATVFLRNITLRGNIIVYSSTKIKVDKSAILEDVLLIAPIIEIGKNTVGNFQAFATKELKVGEQCDLKYPSALVLLSNKSQKNIANTPEASFFIKKGAKIKGIVLFENEDTQKINFNQQVVIAENTMITGEVYCNQNLELLGTVYGSVYTNKFITKQFGSVYVNHLYNAEINRTKLPVSYCGLAIEGNTQKVAKWVY